MDSVTLVALIGVGGTVVGSLAGVFGAGRTAKLSARAQSSLEDKRSRRAVYSACATALLVQNDAARRVMDLMDDPDVELARVTERLRQAQAAHDEIGSTVGAVTVEGPVDVAVSASEAANRIRRWLDALEWQLDLGVMGHRRPQEHRDELRERRQEAATSLAVYSGLCRAALHPQENRIRRFAPLKRRRLERSIDAITRRHGLDGPARRGNPQEPR
ncbi:hypothetical protein ACH4ZU_36910 [Streptomyces sp. NPDC020472]|uniref:hypothetical protein n=1 Tax=Streptomyces sp. NPDC020472 TaxID=3365075 RepID=UPI00378B4D2F